MNKKKSFIIVIACIIVIAIVAAASFFVFRCETGETEKTSVVVKNFNLSDKVYLSEEDTTLGSYTIDLSFDFPVSYKEQEVLKKIQDTIRTVFFGDNMDGIPEDSLLYRYAADLGKEYISNNADFAERMPEESYLTFNHFFSEEGFILLNDENIFSYGILLHVYSGGAHPFGGRTFYNFNLKNGKVILEEEIFTAGYEEALTKIIKDKLLENFNSENKTQYTNIDEAGFFTEEIRPNNNFYINDEGICYVFNAYEIAPYSIGESEVVLPYQSIRHLMKPQNPLEYLVTAALGEN